MKEKYAKLEATRNALRKGVKIQNELIDKLQNENLNLKKGKIETTCFYCDPWFSFLFFFFFAWRIVNDDLLERTKEYGVSEKQEG